MEAALGEAIRGMPKRNVLVAAALAAILGFALGGSFVWAFLKPLQAPPYHRSPDAAKDHAEAQAANEKENTDRELTVYTLWLMIFTGVLAAATIWLGSATYGLYRAGEKQMTVAIKAANAAEASAEHIPRVERAYLTGGGPVRSAGGRRFFRIEVENHGKTPAYLCAFDVHFTTLKEAQSGPQEVFPMRLFDDRIKPGAILKPLDWIEITRSNDDVIYGAFWYQDLLKREHIFRFILRIDANDMTRTGVAGVDDSYTYWD